MEDSAYEIKILVVDDNENNLLVIQKILADMPISIETASSGEEALRHMLRSEYAVVFLDVQMPEMDGYQVAESLSKNEATSKTPIVFVTAKDQRDEIQKGYDVGAIDYLSKPIDPMILIAKTKIFIRLYKQQKSLSLANKKLDELAHVDDLTGLANRQQFRTLFSTILENSKRFRKQFAILLLDLDNFKMVNDTYGHHMGDSLLQSVSNRLKARLRQSDIVARLGGDEFVILLPQIQSPNNAGYLAKTIIEKLNEDLILDDILFKMRVSIGIAIYPFGGDSIDELFKSADIALYRAKEQGRNTFQYYTSSIQKSYKRRVLIEEATQKAMKENIIHLAFQPRVNIKTNKIVCFETLARWHDPSLGDISPAEFIQIAEEMGHIMKLGQYLLSQTFKQLSVWQKKYIDNEFVLAINISPFQLLDNNFLLTVNAFLDAYEINPNRIEFELTESIFKGEGKALEKVLNEIHEIGIAISIDDFGTGYSSLARLKRYPISTLKIDQSFVRDILVDSNDASIVQAIIAMAKTLGIEVVAEGVEVKEQAEFLLKKGCSIAQGFYYSKGVSSEAVDKLLVKGVIDK